jgi:DNA polymerase-3 subunit beta
MKFAIPRETLLKPLQSVIGVVERRQTMPILSNVLLKINNNQLSMTCTDLEIELVAKSDLDTEINESGIITVPARKLLDICRVLPENAQIDCYQDNDKNVIVRSGRSRFVLATLAADSFPNIEWDEQHNVIEFATPQNQLRALIESTCFAMAEQDVRYYLNGLLLEIKKGMLWVVAADGHRMALNAMPSTITNDSILRFIIPRKGITELMRLLEDTDDKVKVAISDNHIRIMRTGLVFTCKLIDGKFPDYERTIPRGGDKEIIIDRKIFQHALSRVAILSSDMFCGVQLAIKPESLHMLTRNQEREEAEEEIAIEYQGEEMTIGFNVNYLLDILASVATEKIVMILKDNTSSVLIEEHGKPGNNLYVVMPLRL